MNLRKLRDFEADISRAKVCIRDFGGPVEALKILETLWVNLHGFIMDNSTEISQNKSYFPLLIMYEDSKNSEIVKTPEEIRQGVSFTVCQTNYERKEVCYNCNKEVTLVSLDGHSIGLLHAVCPICKSCPDCDEGAV